MNRSSQTYTHKAVNRFVGKALHRYRMIEEGDRIAVGLSGGKDSLCLIRILHERQARVPVHYEFIGIYVDPGFEGGFSNALKAYCEKQGYPFHLEGSDHGIRGHSPENRENPCFLCARLRRKRLFELADSLGCNKLALGHTKDDVIATLLMNMFYAGEISTMLPVQTLFNGKFTLIRPLVYVDEHLIRRYAKEASFPAFRNPCPTAGASKRSEIKSMLDDMSRRNRKIKGNLFHALHRVRQDYLWAGNHDRHSKSAG